MGTSTLARLRRGLIRCVASQMCSASPTIAEMRRTIAIVPCPRKSHSSGAASPDKVWMPRRSPIHTSSGGGHATKSHRVGASPARRCHKIGRFAPDVRSAPSCTVHTERRRRKQTLLSEIDPREPEQTPHESIEFLASSMRTLRTQALRSPSRACRRRAPCDLRGFSGIIPQGA